MRIIELRKNWFGNWEAAVPSLGLHNIGGDTLMDTILAAEYVAHDRERLIPQDEKHLYPCEYPDKDEAFGYINTDFSIDGMMKMVLATTYGRTFLTEGVGVW